MPQITVRQIFRLRHPAACVAAVLALVGLGSRPSLAATYYWNTASGLWTTGGNWSDNFASGGTTGAVPTNNTTADSAVFNQAAVNGSQQIQLAQNQSIAGITIRNTGSTTLVSDSVSARTLSIGSGGLVVAAGAGPVTIGSGAARVNLAIAGSQAIVNNSGSDIVLTGTVSRLATAGTTQTLTFAGAGNTTITGQLVQGGTAGGLSFTKSGAGTLTFSGAAASSVNPPTLAGGTVVFDFANYTGTNLLAQTDINLSGGRLLVQGRATGTASQAFSNVFVNAGGGAILADPKGGSTSVALGTVGVPGPGGTLLVGMAPGSTGTATFTRNAGVAVNGSAYNRLTVFTDGAEYNWSTSLSSSGPYVLSAFSNYVSLATTSGTDTSQSRITSNTTLAGTRSTATLKIENPAEAQTLAIGANDLKLTSGGLLVTGSNGFRITTTGGVLDSSTELIFQQFNTGGLTVDPRLTSVTTVTKAGPGLLVLTSTNNGFTAPIFINSGTLAIGGAGRRNGTTGTYAGNVAIATDGAFEFASSSASILSGTLSGAGAFRQTGSGTTTLSGVNTYSGQTRVSAGVLTLGAANAISSQSNLLVDGGGFNLAGFNDTVGTVTLTSGSIFGSGTLAGSSYALQGGALNTVLGSGSITVSTGTTTLGSAGRFHSSSRLTISSGQLTIGGNETVGSFVLTGGTLAGSGNTLTSGSAYDVQSGSVLANLGGSVGLMKSTGGTVTLSGSNTFSGQTTISSGILALGVNGSLGNSTSINVGDAGSAGAVLDLTAKTAAFTLNATQTLSGGGMVRVAPAQQFLVQGTFSPGNSPGLFTFDGGTTELSGTTVMEVFGTSRATAPSHGSGFYDAVNIVNNGTLQFGGNLTLEFSSLFDNNTAFDIFSPASGSSLSGNFTGVSVVGGFYTGLDWSPTGTGWKSSSTAGGQSLEFNASAGQLVIVPEPHTLVLAGIGFAAAAWAGTNRRRRCAS